MPDGFEIQATFRSTYVLLVLPVVLMGLIEGCRVNRLRRARAPSTLPPHPGELGPELSDVGRGLPCVEAQHTICLLPSLLSHLGCPPLQPSYPEGADRWRQSRLRSDRTLA